MHVRARTRPSGRLRRGRSSRRGSVAGGLLAVLLGAVGLSVVPVAAADVTQDLGDAPAAFDRGPAGPASATLPGPRLGATVTADAIDPETGVSVYASDSADGDAGDDAVAAWPLFESGRLGQFDQEVGVSGVTGPSRLCGWIDFDQSLSFDAIERACVDLASGSETAALRWIGLPAGPGQSYLRLRIGPQSEQVERPTGPGDAGEVEDYAIQFVEPPPTRAELSLTEQVTPGRVTRVGESVRYEFVASNDGDVSLSDVRISDELPGLSPLECDAAPPVTLTPGADLTCTATRTTTQQDLDFGAIFDISEAVGEPPDGDPEDDSDDATAVADARVDAVQQPRLEIAATTGSRSAAAGRRIGFSFTATNTGNVTLSSPAIATSREGASLTCPDDAPDALAPGESLTCSGGYGIVAADARRGAVTITATVRAEKPYGDPASSSDDATARASLRVAVASASSAAAGSGQVGTLAATGGPTSVLFGLGVLACVGGAALLVRAR